jgi:putative spermidine/putrescine transport system permease protein
MTQPLRIALMLTPAVLVIGLLFGGALVVAVLRSLDAGGAGLSFAAYSRVLSNPDFLASFALTFHIAFTSTVLSAVLAIGAALLIRASVFGRGVMTFLFQLNLTVPHVVGAIGMLYLFGQSGSFARLSHAMGLIDRPADFPALIFDPYAIGIILHYVWKEVPFIGTILLAQMQAIGPEPEASARSLGATRWQAVRHVLLPLILPGLLGASAISFAFAFGAYEIPALLGASHPQALPVLAWRSYTATDLAARPDALAMTVVIALLSGLLLAAYLRAARLRGRG